jgi:hypothetical protein
LFWIQYVVAYDRQEQRTLVNSLRRQWRDARGAAGLSLAALMQSLRAWWSASSEDGANGAATSPSTLALLFLVGCILTAALFFFARRFWRRIFARGVGHSGETEENSSDVNFYRRLTAALEARGLRRSPDQTPLEFASATGVPEVLTITRAYHRVRYGAQQLTPNEADEIEQNLRRVEESVKS